MLSHAELKRQALKKPEVRAEYEALAEEYALARELLRARVEAGLTQVEVAESMQTRGSAVARLEAGGRHSPSMSTLRKYADAVGCLLEVRLIPKSKLKTKK